MFFNIHEKNHQFLTSVKKDAQKENWFLFFWLTMCIFAAENSLFASYTTDDQQVSIDGDRCEVFSAGAVQLTNDRFVYLRTSMNVNRLLLQMTTDSSAAPWRN